MPLYKASASELAALVAADNDTSGFIKDTEGWRVLGASGVAATVTNTLTETALATIAKPAGAMGSNGILRITATFSTTSSANAKVLRVRLGGIGGTAHHDASVTTTATTALIRTIQNRNSASSQVSTGSGSASGVGSSATTAVTSAINTANAQDIVITGQMAALGETITLESYVVELKYGT